MPRKSCIQEWTHGTVNNAEHRARIRHGTQIVRGNDLHACGIARYNNFEIVRMAVGPSPAMFSRLNPGFHIG